MNNSENNIANAKLAELKKLLPVLLLAPYTKILFLAGSVATGLARPDSDIDLIIISKNNRVWLNRFFLEIITRIFKIRRTKNNFKNKICFNIFLTNKNPLLPHPDFIGASFYKNIKPVWCENKTDLGIFWDKNFWIKKHFELPSSATNILFSKKYKLTNYFKKSLEIILDFSGLGFILEKISFALQKKYLYEKFNAHKNKTSSDFFVNPNLIAYHFPVANYFKEKTKIFNARHQDVDNPSTNREQPNPKV